MVTKRGGALRQRAPRKGPSGLTFELLEQRLLMAAWTGTLGTDTLWSAAEVQTVTGTLVVPTGVTLTIEPGTVVKVAANGRLDVSGTVLAPGTTTDPIFITSIKDDTLGGDTNGDGALTVPAGGDWRQVRLFSGGSFVADNTHIRYAGASNLSSAVQILDGDFTLTNGEISHSAALTSVILLQSGAGAVNLTGTTVRESNNIGVQVNSLGNELVNLTNLHVENTAGVGVFVIPSANFDLTGATFSNTANDGAVGVSSDGAIAGARTWAGGQTYLLQSHLVIPSGAQLTLDPGAVLKFNALRGIQIDGTLLAPGTAEDPIIFTSIKDDSVGGDSNGDGNATMPTPGSWFSLWHRDGFQVTLNTAVTALDHVEVRYAGVETGTVTPAVLIDGGSFTMTNSLITDAPWYGLRTRQFATSTVVLDNVTVRNAGSGAAGDAAIELQTGNNTFTNIHVENILGDAMRIVPDQVQLDLDGLTTSNVTGFLGTRVIAGTVSRNLVLGHTPQVLLEGTLEVSAGGSLTVLPGTTVLMSPGGGTRSLFGRHGPLHLHGTLEQPILFTTSDDGAANPMFGSGPVQTTATAGSWNGLDLSAGGGVSHVEVRNAGRDNSAAILVQSPDIEILNVLIHGSLGSGIWSTRPGTRVTNALIYDYIHSAFRKSTTGLSYILNSNTFHGGLYGVHSVHGAVGAAELNNNSISGASVAALRFGHVNQPTNINLSHNNLFAPEAAEGLISIYDPGITTVNATGNISANPQYGNPATGNFTLTPTSPNIDAGNGDKAPLTDRQGLPRTDLLSVPNTGTGTPNFVDIGVAELQTIHATVDLVVENVTVDKTSVEPGGEVTVRWRVRNTSQVAAFVTLAAGVSLSSEPTPGGIEIPLDSSYEEDFVGPGEFLEFERTITINAPIEGPVYVLVKTGVTGDDLNADPANSGSQEVTVTVPPSPLDGEFTRTIGDLLTGAYYKVVVPAGQTLALQRPGDETQPVRVTVAHEDDFADWFYEIDRAAEYRSVDSRGPLTILEPQTTEGTYYYRVQSMGGLPQTPLHFTPILVPAGVHLVTPASVGNGGLASLLLQGSALDLLDAVDYSLDFGPPTRALGLTHHSPSAVTVTIDLTGVEPGMYQIQGLAADGETIFDEIEIEVVPAVFGALEYSISSNEFMRGGTTAPVTVTLTNPGNNDLPLSLVDLSVDSPFAGLLLAPGGEPQPFISLVPPSSFGTPGYLAGGQSVNMTVHVNLAPNAFGPIDIEVGTATLDAAAIEGLLGELPGPTQAELMALFFHGNEQRLVDGQVTSQFGLGSGVTLTLDQLNLAKNIAQYAEMMGVSPEDVEHAGQHGHTPGPKDYPSGTRITTIKQGTSGKVRYITAGFIAGYKEQEWTTRLANALECVYPDDTIKLINWDSASESSMADNILDGAAKGAILGGPFFPAGAVYGAIFGGISTFLDAAQRTQQVAADILADMHASGHDPGQTSMYGHSLGGQIAGHLGQLTFGQLDMIVAFDPAGPTFQGDSTTRLDPDDARKVIVINSSRTFGTFDDVGDENYYPEVTTNDPVAAHAESYEYFLRELEEHCEDVDEGNVPAGSDPVLDASPNKPPGIGERFTSAVAQAIWRVTTVGSYDPNDITGPAGAGEGRHLVPAQLMPFTIRFENDPDLATAAAQVVTITQFLDPDLDWTTFELGSFGFGETVATAPPGLASYTTAVNGTNHDGTPVKVVIDADLDFATGRVIWTFTSLDPATDLPPADPFAGFLPVNNEDHDGEGFVTYRIRSLADRTSGTELDSIASIVFDFNAPIITNLWTNTIDTAPPTSAVTPLPAQSESSFLVSWSGSDEAGGSGIATYDVFVSDDDGPFALWQDATAATSAMFIGEVNHIYSFYSVATDLVGRREADAPAADATTTVVPPVGLPLLAGEKLIYTDADGTNVTVSIKGGEGSFQLDGDNLNIVQIKKVFTVTGDNVTLSQFTVDNAVNAAITVSAKGGDGRAVWGGLTINGSAKSVKMPAIDMEGDVIITGLASTLALGSVIGDRVISLGGAPTDRASKVTLARLVDVTMTSDAPLQLTVVSWTDTDPLTNPDSLTAPYAATITAKGDTKQAIPGLWQADVSLTGAGAAADVLKSFKAQSLSDSIFEIAGAIGTFDVSKGTVEDFTLTAGNANTVKLGDVSDATLTAEDVATLQAIRWLDGAISADTLKTLKIIGDKKTPIAGDMNASLTINGDPAAKSALGAATIAGLLGGQWQIDGPVGTITAGDVDDFTGNVTGALNAFTSKAAFSGLLAAFSFAMIDVKTNLTDARFIAGGNPAAAFINALKIGGNMTNSTVAVGVDPVNGIFGDGDDLLLAGPLNQIKSMTIAGITDADTPMFFAGLFPKSVSINKIKIDPLLDARFVLSPDEP